MAKEVLSFSGADEKDFISSGHPNTFQGMAKAGVLKPR